MTNKPTKKPIPEFACIEEEAEFWDTHDWTGSQEMSDIWEEIFPR